MSLTGVTDSGGRVITAGLGGFLVLFGLALVVWFLGRDLSRRLRRMRLAEAQRLRAESPATEQPDDGAAQANPATHAAQANPATHTDPASHSGEPTAAEPPPGPSPSARHKPTEPPISPPRP